jgi:hypothetical protein
VVDPSDTLVFAAMLEPAFAAGILDEDTALEAGRARIHRNRDTTASPPTLRSSDNR